MFWSLGRAAVVKIQSNSAEWAARVENTVYAGIVPEPALPVVWVGRTGLAAGFRLLICDFLGWFARGLGGSPAAGFVGCACGGSGLTSPAAGLFLLRLRRDCSYFACGGLWDVACSGPHFEKRKVGKRFSRMIGPAGGALWWQ